MAPLKTAKFEKKLSSTNYHLILTAIKNKKYTQALAKEIPEIPLDPLQKRIRELEAMGINKGWINDP